MHSMRQAFGLTLDRTHQAERCLGRDVTNLNTLWVLKIIKFHLWQNVYRCSAVMRSLSLRQLIRDTRGYPKASVTPPTTGNSKTEPVTLRI